MVSDKTKDLSQEEKQNILSLRHNNHQIKFLKKIINRIKIKRLNLVCFMMLKLRLFQNIIKLVYNILKENLINPATIFKNKLRN